MTTYQVNGLDSNGCTTVSREAFTLKEARTELSLIETDNEYRAFGDLVRIQIVNDENGDIIVDKSVVDSAGQRLPIRNKRQAGNASVVLLGIIAFFLLMPVCGGFARVHFHAHDMGALAVLAFVVLLVKAVKS